MFRRSKPTQPQSVHRGRIYRTRDWWVYRCNVCDHSAGARTPHGDVTVQWLIRQATEHAKTGPR